MHARFTSLIFFVLLPVLLVGCAQKPAQGPGAAVTEAAENTAPTPERKETVPSVIEAQNGAPTSKPESCSLRIEPVDNLPEDFIFGMDASQVPSLEQSGVKYYDFDGTETDVFKILAENGINYIRVRVWNDPFDAEGHGYGGGNCTIRTALEIGRRAAKYGMKLLVDFHYSDFWADPGKQMVPKAWKDMDLDTKAAVLEQYTLESLHVLKNADVDVGIVQVGNETNGAMCGEKDWPSVARLMAAGARAIRAVYPQALVAVHFADPESGAYPGYAKALAENGLDYDVFGSSYYPYWHGTLENLTRVLCEIRQTYGKQVMVMETSYAWTAEDSDFSANTISADSRVTQPYPYSLQGQVDSLRNVTQAVADAGGIGVCYWEGAWISVGGASREANRKLWEEFGSGWASSYAGEYDPEDAGKWYGGCAVDNQAFFDANGRALESLMAFHLIRRGNDVPLDPQYEKALAALHEPEAPQIPEDENLLKNPSFEDGVDSPWVAKNLGGCRELNPEQKPGDSRTGEWHYHFWSPDAGTVEFTLEQTPEDLAAGTFAFRIYIMGGDCGEAEVYAYAKVDGEIVRTAPMQITVWNEWHLGEITGIELAEGQILTVGIYVKAPAGGAWGKIDDAALTQINH